MKKILGLALIVSLAACGGNDKPAQEVKQAPLVQSKNSAAFNLQFDKLMDDYFQLKDNFISEKDSAITAYAKAIIADVDSLNLKELKADTSVIGTAKSFVIDYLKKRTELIPKSQRHWTLKGNIFKY